MNVCKRAILPLATSLLAVAALVLGPAAGAMPPNKVAVCHVPADTPDNYKARSFPDKGGVIADHLSHGDWLVTDPLCEDDIDDNNCDGVADDPNALNYDCVIQTGNADATCENRVCIEPDPAIARAFIDVDPADGSAFNPDKDIVIAELLDSDGTLGFTVGDTLRFGQYPKISNPCPAGDCTGNLANFTNTTHTVTAKIITRPELLDFEIDTPCNFAEPLPTPPPQGPASCRAIFQIDNVSSAPFEAFKVFLSAPRQIPSPPLPDYYWFYDSQPGSAFAYNRLIVNTQGDPATATTPLPSALVGSSTDDPFLDVIIY
jgi:hypothetical protein